MKLVGQLLFWLCISSVVQSNSEKPGEDQEQKLSKSFEFTSVVHPRQHELVFGGFHIGTIMIHKTSSDLFKRGDYFHKQLNLGGTHLDPDDLAQLSRSYYKFPKFLENGKSRMIDASGDYVIVEVSLTKGKTDNDAEFSGEFGLREGFGSFEGVEGQCNFDWTMPFAGAALMKGRCRVSR